jgi:hypothetical protein
VLKPVSVNVGKVVQGERFGRLIVPLFFFTCYFFFLLYYIGPAVIYSGNGFNIHTYVQLMHASDASSYTDLLYRRLFILELTPSYLWELAFSPGGITWLAATLCIYACRYPLAGAIVVTGLAFFFHWIFTLYLLGVGARRPIVLPFVPSFFILTMCAWYELSFCALLLPVGGALAFAVLYRRFRPPTALRRAVWLTVFFWSAWYVLQWGCLALLLFIVIDEMFSKKSAIGFVALSAAANAALFFFVDARLVPLPMTVRFSEFLMLSGLPIGMIGFFPFVAIALAAASRLWRAPEGTAKTIRDILRAAFLVCGTVAAVTWLCKDPVNRDTRTVARTMHHVLSGKWEEILREKTAPFFTDFPQKSGALQVFMMQAVNHALYRTGRLGETMFTFPQAVFSYDPLLMLQSMFIYGYVNWVVVLDLAMDLGMLNTAEKIAGELMEKMGPYPDILYRRALVQIAKGNKEAGAVYLKRLARMPFYRAEAKRLLGKLDDDQAIYSQPRIATMHANQDTVDYFLDNNLGCNVMFKHLLKSNPGNKVAYDYLMTYCLLYDRLDDLAALAPGARAFGYTALPRHWEEALCLHQAVRSPQAPSEISFSGVGPQTVERFYKFTKAMMQTKHDPEAAAKLAPLFGDSYFYFSIFNYSPGTFHE